MKQEQKKHPKNYPDEYITGTVTFFGREFHVTPDVLIPRLETEGLVRRAREILKIQKFERLVDIGCGSGIIGTSLADLSDEVIFLDISDGALQIAKENFSKYYPPKRAQFILSDLLSGFATSHHTPVFFLANLPYIKEDDWENMSPDTRYEPKLALFGGKETGFELYEELFEQIQSKGILGTLLIEFGFDQREIAEDTIKKYGWQYEFFADYAGIERFCEVHL